MKLTEEKLKKIIQQVLSEGEVPQEAKDKLFNRMVNRGAVPEGEGIEDAEFWEVEEGDYGFKDAVKVGDKYYYGEI